MGLEGDASMAVVRCVVVCFYAAKVVGVVLICIGRIRRCECP